MRQRVRGFEVCVAVGVSVASLALATPASAQVVLNEILADPGTAVGDANCDGVIDTVDDEFVEIVNAGTAVVDLSGGTLSDLVGVRHVFPAGTTLQPGQAVVVFGGGAPTFDGTSSSPGSWCVALPGVRFQTASTGTVALNNTGDTITLADVGGTVLDAYTYGSEGGNDNSLVRDPELSAAPMVEHDTTGFGDWSPGTTVDGVPYAGVAAFSPTLSQAFPGIAGVQNTWRLDDGPPNEQVVFLYGQNAGVTPVPACSGLSLSIAGPRFLGNGTTAANGREDLVRTLPAVASGRTVRVQALFLGSCVVSDVSVTPIQ